MNKAATWGSRFGFLLILGGADWIAWCAHRVDGWALLACIVLCLIEFNIAYAIARVARKTGVVI